MGKTVTIELDAKRMEGALRGLSRLTGKDFRTVCRSEMEAALTAAARRVDAADVSKIRANHEAQPITAVRGYAARNNSRQKLQTSDGRTIYWLKNRYPNELWGLIQQHRQKRLKEKLAARGLAKKVFLQIAETLGLNIKVPGYVVKATTPKGDYPQDAGGSEHGTINYYIEGVTRRVYARNVFSAVSRALRGRISYFERNLKSGVFKKAKDIARRYPGLQVNGN